MAAPFIDMPDLSDIINAAKANADQTYIGWTQINGSNITINDSIFVDGDLQINGSNVTVNGALMATGSIQVTGSNITLTGKDGLSLYAGNGNIQVHGSTPVIHGLVYAPHGEFQSSAKLTVYGQVIVDSLQLDGSDISIIYDDEHLNTLGLSGGKTALIE
jgi:cytoskeletal protein CcmA (bactofilin family)